MNTVEAKKVLEIEREMAYFLLEWARSHFISHTNYTGEVPLKDCAMCKAFMRAHERAQRALGTVSARGTGDSIK